MQLFPNFAIQSAEVLWLFVNLHFRRLFKICFTNDYFQ